MMKIIFLVFIPLAWSYGPNTQGGGAFAYVDSTGNRYPAFGGFGMPSFGNSAFASAAAGPGFQHHIAAISPSNPGMPNVDRVSHFADSSLPGGRKFYSVSSKSYSSSSNINGKEISNRGAETLVNDNGKVTHYKVQN
uniref:Uncharacterized protein n=1 Tax=Heliothis virescens TaxID=7102 RepID=A0A2A4JGD7_HELVI